MINASGVIFEASSRQKKRSYKKLSLSLGSFVSIAILISRFFGVFPSVAHASAQIQQASLTPQTIETTIASMSAQPPVATISAPLSGPDIIPAPDQVAPEDSQQEQEQQTLPTPDAQESPSVLQNTPPSSLTFSNPITRIPKITTYFSGFHPGVDLAVPYGIPIYAAMSGTVIHSGWDTTGYGNSIVISNGSYTTRYAHLSANYTSIGQIVSQGQEIGLVGCTGHCTGPHLHFEIRQNGIAVNPLRFIGW